MITWLMLFALLSQEDGVTVAKPGLLDAPPLLTEPIPDGLPAPIPVEGGTCLPSPLDIAVQLMLDSCMSYEDRCAVRISGAMRIGQAAVESCQQQCEVDKAAVSTKTVIEEGLPKWAQITIGVGVAVIFGAGGYAAGRYLHK